MKDSLLQFEPSINLLPDNPFRTLDGKNVVHKLLWGPHKHLFGRLEKRNKVKWKWNNVPIPEAHLVGLVIGISFHLFFSKTLFQFVWIGHVIGWPLIVVGIGLCTWSVIEAKEMSISTPNVLLTSGPYSLNRNPMYVGWTLIYSGIALAVNSVWIILFLPVVFLYIHFVDIHKEEQYLDEQFGEEYRQYRERVRRYF